MWLLLALGALANEPVDQAPPVEGTLTEPPANPFPDEGPPQAEPIVAPDLFAPAMFSLRVERKPRPLDTDDAIIGMIRSTVDGQIPTLRAACWESRLAHFPELYGTWQIDLVVLAAGTPSAVVVTAIDVPDAQVEACLAARAATWRFLPIQADTPAARRVRFGEPSTDAPEPELVDGPS